MKLGLSSYSFTWAVGVPGHLPEKRHDEISLLELTKELGISLLQIADNMPLHLMHDEQVENLVQKARELNIVLEAGAKNLTPENIENYIYLTEKLDSTILRFIIDGPDYKPTVDEIVPVIINVEPELKKRNIILALENYDRFSVHDFVKIVERVNSPYVGICLDCANSMGVGEGFREVVDCLAPHTVNFHLKEVSIKRKFHMMGFDIEGKPFGEGILPLEWMLSQLPPACKTAILEQWTPPEGNIQDSINKELEWAKKSIKYLSSYFKL